MALDLADVGGPHRGRSPARDHASGSASTAGRWSPASSAREKFIYDVWGDTVNLASRMESLGVPGRVQVTHAVVERLGGAFEFEARGLIDVKGKGPTPTYFVCVGSMLRR